MDTAACDLPNWKAGGFVNGGTFHCRCGAQLMAPPGVPAVQCPSCGQVAAVPAGAPVPGAAGGKSPWLIVGIFLGVVGVAAIIAFAMSSGGTGYRTYKKSRTSESRQFVKKMYDGARAYYMDQSYQSGSLQVLPKQFPGPSTGLVPPDPTACCEKCAPDASQWMDDVWTALQFSVDDPHYYSYQYIVSDDRQSFTVRALGDLDCDGLLHIVAAVLGFVAIGPCRQWEAFKLGAGLQRR